MNAYIRICCLVVFVLIGFGMTSAALGRPLGSVTTAVMSQNSEPDPATLALRRSQRANAGTTFYVSPGGNNQDGRSWATAWRELDQIAWSSVKPGDTILLAPDRYESSLVVKASGTANAPIRFEARGDVVIFGGIPSRYRHATVAVAGVAAVAKPVLISRALSTSLSTA